MKSSLPVRTVAEVLLTAAAEDQAPGDLNMLGITGINASGKTSLASELVRLSSTANPVDVIHIDDFHNPKAYRYNAPPGNQFLERYFDFELLQSRVLDQLGIARISPVHFKRLDLDTDSYVQDSIYLAESRLLVLEGVFLALPQLRPYIHRLVVLDVSYAVALDRGIRRWNHLPAREVERRFREKYWPGQHKYERAHKPKESADAIMDFNDLSAVQLTDSRWPSLTKHWHAAADDV